MIYKETVLKVIDNSGAKKARCIDIYRAGKSGAAIGDCIRVAIEKVDPKSNVKKGDVFKAIIVMTAAKFRRKDLSSISFQDNAVVLINEKKDPVGTRIKGIVPKEVPSNLRNLAEGII